MVDNVRYARGIEVQGVARLKSCLAAGSKVRCSGCNVVVMMLKSSFRLFRAEGSTSLVTFTKIYRLTVRVHMCFGRQLIISSLSAIGLSPLS